MQQALLRLEKGGILVSHLVGKTRIFQFNPHYLFLKDLCALLQRAYDTIPEDIKKKYYQVPVRTRPRRTGKPLP